MVLLRDILLAGNIIAAVYCISKMVVEDSVIGAILGTVNILAALRLWGSIKTD